MLFDMRTYVCRPNLMRRHLDVYAQHGFEVQRRHLGDPVLYALTETGPQNSFVHIWAYDSAEDRARRRAAMQADPDWGAYVARSAEAGYLQSQENRLLLPVAFFEHRKPSAGAAA